MNQKKLRITIERAGTSRPVIENYTMGLDNTELITKFILLHGQAGEIVKYGVVE